MLRALVALFNRVPQPTGRVVVAHFNHQLRGVEANADAEFVGRLCQQLEVPFHQGSAERPACVGGEGLEAEARAQRYAFFRDLANRLGARYVATGHTADDQSETILHRIIRGTGLAGLAGIPPTRSLSELTTIVRPMLKIHRCDVLNYLEELRQPFCVDSSNCLTDLVRNRIRHQLIPHLAEDYNPGIAQALIRLGRQATDAMSVIDDLVDPLWDQSVLAVDAVTVKVVCAVLANQPPYLVRHLMTRLWKHHGWPMRDMCAVQWEQLAGLIQDREAHTRSITLPGPVQARRVGGEVWLQWGGGVSRKSS